MTGGCVVLVQLVLRRCCVLTSGSQCIKHNRIEFVSIVCSNKPLLLISVLMALFVISTISAAIIQIIGSLSNIKKETEELYDTVMNPPQIEDTMFDEKVQRRTPDDFLSEPIASRPADLLQVVTSTLAQSTPHVECAEHAATAAGRTGPTAGHTRPTAGHTRPTAGHARPPAPHVLALPVLRVRSGPAERRLASYSVIATLRAVDDKPDRSTIHHIL